MEETGGIRDLPVETDGTTDLRLQVDILPIIQQVLATRAPAAVASKYLVQGVLDGQVLLEQQSLHWAFAQRPKHLLHPLHRLNLHPDPLNAAEADAAEVPAEAGDLASCLADPNVDSAGHVLAGATEIILLPRKTFLEPGQLVAQSQQRFSRVVHFRHLRWQTAA